MGRRQPSHAAVITLATDERDPDDPTDDGHRNIYCKGKMLNAVKQALKAAGQKLEAGGTLAVQYTGDGTPTNPRHNPPKEYVAAYEAPSRVAGADALLGNTAAPQAPAMAPAGPKLL